MTPHAQRALLVLALSVLTAAAALLTGCAPRITEFQITDHRRAGALQYHQAFDECVYRRDAANNLEIVARHQTTDDQGQTTLQVIHLKTFWHVRLGHTRADRSMLNTCVSYMILTWPTGAAFEGSGFMTCRENRPRDQLQAHLELSSLKPQRRLGNAEKLFDRAELAGRLTARRDEPRVIEILNEMKNAFGPPPNDLPPQSDRDF